MSPGAAPSLPSQLKVHFSFCLANLWLIVESFVSFDPVYPCCYIVCDLPTELSRSNLCLTLTSTPCRNYKPLLDILSKHWEFASIWHLLKPILFWKGDTHELNDNTKGSDRIPANRAVSIPNPNGQRMNEQP